ncbi:unnamed protein product [Meloidogyne enterolobii]|uniref:Uncharacterized protein n=1 Tax=Meloidogyne enterolobii TaxID=390850 RepID=A0ACB0Y555_MELEN
MLAVLVVLSALIVLLCLYSLIRSRRLYGYIRKNPLISFVIFCFLYKSYYSLQIPKYPRYQYARKFYNTKTIWHSLLFCDSWLKRLQENDRHLIRLCFAFFPFPSKTTDIFLNS